MIKIGIIDYGIGNVYSLVKCLKSIGYRAITSSDSLILEKCDLLVLPGVGSFPYAMKQLFASKLDKFIINQSKSKKPIIGICLGMQLLTQHSEENGGHLGLGIIPGKITKNKNSEYHIGWNNIETPKEKLFSKKFNNHEFFFNHGYSFQGNNKYILSKTNFGGSFASAIMKENIIGFQFHPEKSQKAGLQLLKSTINFLIKHK